MLRLRSEGSLRSPHCFAEHDRIISFGFVKNPSRAFCFAQDDRWGFLTHDLLFERHGASAAGRTLYSVPELANVDLQFSESAAKRVAVHAQFAGGTALVAFVFIEHRENESFLELPSAL